MDERSWRMLAANEALHDGYGGISRISRACGLSRVTITKGIRNALSVCELLRQIAARHVGLPITMILDNARYQKCALVQQLAATLNIELLYLPAYSPNLNLIERSWRFVKKKVLYCHYYKDFGSFQAAIADCVNQAHVTYREELEALLTLRFQTFEKTQKMAA